MISGRRKGRLFGAAHRRLGRFRPLLGCHRRFASTDSIERGSWGSHRSNYESGAEPTKPVLAPRRLTGHAVARGAPGLSGYRGLVLPPDRGADRITGRAGAAIGLRWWRRSLASSVSLGASAPSSCSPPNPRRRGWKVRSGRSRAVWERVGPSYWLQDRVDSNVFLNVRWSLVCARSDRPPPQAPSPAELREPLTQLIGQTR